METLRKTRVPNFLAIEDHAPMQENESAIEEIKQIMHQYSDEVGRGRKAWPRSIKERVRNLFLAGVKGNEISRRTGISYYTVLNWRPNKQKPVAKNFRELAIVSKPSLPEKLATVTVPTSKNLAPEKVGTVTVTTPDGFRVEVDLTQATELIRELRKSAGGVS